MNVRIARLGSVKPATYRWRIYLSAIRWRDKKWHLMMHNECVTMPQGFHADTLDEMSEWLIENWGDPSYGLILNDEFMETVVEREKIGSYYSSVYPDTVQGEREIKENVAR